MSQDVKREQETPTSQPERPHTLLDDHWDRLMRAALGDSDSGETRALIGATNLDAAMRQFADLEEASVLIRPSALQTGQKFGKFELHEEVGRGGFGVVYRATDTQLGRCVALKFPRPDRVYPRDYLRRFSREACLAAQLEHAAIVPVYEAGELEETVYIASKFENGEAMSDWLVRQGGFVDPWFAARIVERIASGLTHAHGRRITHGDLKPANVLMVKSERSEKNPVGWVPRITDFGLGELHDANDERTGSGLMQGTPAYMAPEQVLSGAGPVDHRADIHALGLLLYELMTGQQAHPGRTLAEAVAFFRAQTRTKSPREIKRSIPLDLEAICNKCLERDPQKRYESAEAVRDDLIRFLAGERTQARPLPRLEQLLRSVRRHPSESALGCVILLGMAAFLWESSIHNSFLQRSKQELELANVRLKSMNLGYASAVQEIGKQERRSRGLAYMSDLRLAAQETAAGHLELAQFVLDRWKPSPGADDLREFTWWYLWREATANGVFVVSPSSALPELNEAGKRVLAWARGISDGSLDGDVDTSSMVIDRAGARLSGRKAAFTFGARPAILLRDSHGKAIWSDGTYIGSMEDLAAGMVALAPDGRTIVVARDDWPTDKAEPIAFRERFIAVGAPEAGRLRILEIPRARRVAVSGDNRSIGCLLETEEGTDRIAVVFMFDLALHALNDARGTAKIIKRARGLDVMGLSWDGSTMALAEDDITRLGVFDTRGAELMWEKTAGELDADVELRSLAFSSDRSVLATCDRHGGVAIWDCAAGILRARLPRQLITRQEAIGFLKDDATLTISTWSEEMMRHWRWQAEPIKTSWLIHGPSPREGKEVWALAFETNSELLSTGDDHVVRKWNLDRGEQVASWGEHETLVGSLALGAENRLLASGDWFGHVIVRDRSNGTARMFKNALQSKVRSLNFSPDGRFLAAGGRSNEFWVLDLKDDSEKRILSAQDTIYAAVFQPRQQRLAVGSHDNKITFWRVPDFVEVGRLTARRPIACMAFSPDGNMLVTCDIEGRLQVWDMMRGEERAAVARASERGGVWAIAFSPDGKTLATGGDDGVVRLWDPGTLERMAQLSGHRAKVHAVAFSPDGRTLATGDFAGTILLWRTSPH